MHHCFALLTSATTIPDSNKELLWLLNACNILLFSKGSEVGSSTQCSSTLSPRAAQFLLPPTHTPFKEGDSKQAQPICDHSFWDSGLLWVKVSYCPRYSYDLRGLVSQADVRGRPGSRENFGGQQIPSEAPSDYWENMPLIGLQSQWQLAEADQALQGQSNLTSFSCQCLSLSGDIIGFKLDGANSLTVYKIEITD